MFFRFGKKKLPQSPKFLFKCRLYFLKYLSEFFNVSYRLTTARLIIKVYLQSGPRVIVNKEPEPKMDQTILKSQ